MGFSAEASECDLYKENQSLLMEILAAGSGDCLPLIFSCLTSLKDKARLERVCKTFRKLARSFAAWSNVTSLIIKDKGENHLINGEYIPTVHLESAIEAIVVRIRNVEVIDLHLCGQSIAYSSVASTITQQCIRSYRNVKELFLNGRNMEALSQSIYQLVALFKDQLQILKLLGIYFMDSNETICLWNLIRNCYHLKELIYHQPFQEKNEKHVLDTIKIALRGKSIEWLDLLIPGINTDNLIEIISSLSKKSLRILKSYGRFYSLTDLAIRLPAVQRNNLKHIVFQFFEESDYFWPTILNLLRHFSQLSTIEYYFRFLTFDFTVNEAVDIIVSYLSILAEENSQRSKFFKLHLFSSALNRLDWDNVFAVLVKEHNCHVHSTAVGTFRVRFDGKERACIDMLI